MKIGVVFGSPEVTTGGNALKFYASMRIDVRRIGQLKVGDETLGHRARIKIVKNKLAPPFRTAEVDVCYGTGLDAVPDLLDLAVQGDVIRKNGAYSSGDAAAGSRSGSGTPRGVRVQRSGVRRLAQDRIKPGTC